MAYLTIDGVAWPVVEGSTRIGATRVAQVRRNLEAALVVDHHGWLVPLTCTIGPLSRADAAALIATLRAPGARLVGGDVLEGAPPFAVHVEGFTRSDVPHRPPGEAPTWMPQVEVTFTPVVPS